MPDRLRRHRAGSAAEWVFLLAAVVVTAVAHPTATDRARFVVTGMLAFGMGIQNAMIRRWGIPELATNVTLTLVGLIADSSLARGTNPRAVRRATSIGIFAASVVVGAELQRAGVLWPLVAALGIFTVALPTPLQAAPETDPPAVRAASPEQAPPAPRPVTER